MSGGFIQVAKTSDVRSGTMICVDVRGRRILVANIEGRYYATDDTCTHEDASLSAGALHGELVTCPLHGSRFNLRTGEPREEPAEEALRTYFVKVEGESILVDVDQDIASK